MTSSKVFTENKKAICVCCCERVNTSDMSRTCGMIGYCKICEQKLDLIPPNSPLEGAESADYVFSVCNYNDTIKRLMYRFKFGREYKLGDLFADMLYEYLKDIPVIGDFDFITAVPLSRKRQILRTFNQSELIARALADKLKIEYISCVYRCRHTAAQSLLNRRERVHNIANAFIADRAKVQNKRILLLDDIYTTGATMASCAGELKDKGAKTVVGVSLAKVINF